MLLRLVIYRSPAIAWATVCLTPKISGRFVRSRSRCPWRMVFLWTFRWRCILWPRHPLPLCIASAPKAPKAHGTTASKSHGSRSSAEPWSTLPTQNPQSWHFLNPPNCTCRIHQNILWFEISMQDAFWVDIGHPVQYLLDDYFNPFLVDFVILARDELLQILLVVIKDYLQGLLLRLVEYLE